MPVHVYTSFLQLPAGVRARAAYPAQSQLFLALDWFEFLYESCLGSTLTPRIYVRSNAAGEPTCALFCGVVREGATRKLVSLTNFYTLGYLPLVLVAEEAEASLAELAGHLCAERPAWDMLRLNLLPSQAPEYRSFVEHLRKGGFDVRAFFQYDNWVHAVGTDDFEAYFAKRPSQTRNTITRKQKKLEKTHRCRIEIVQDSSERLAGAMRDFMTIYNRSWKQPEPYPQFMPGLAALCARLGMLRLGVLYVDDVPAAAQFWITSGGTATIYKLAYDERFADLGVGSILSKALFRQAIDDDHVTLIDYGVGSESYKKDWMSAMQRIEGIEAYNRRTLRGLVLSSMEAAKQGLKKLRRATQEQGS